jgi:hypothetical protein
MKNGFTPGFMTESFMFPAKKIFRYQPDVINTPRHFPGTEAEKKKTDQPGKTQTIYQRTLCSAPGAHQCKKNNKEGPH